MVPGAMTTYTVPFIAGHTWTWTITGGTGSSTTNSINVTWGTGPVGTVTVVVNNTGQSNCSSDPTELQVSISGTNGLGPEAADNAAITLFPNPTTGRVTLRLAGSSPRGTTVRVVDAFGRVLRSTAMQGASIDLDLDGLPRGCYGVLVDTAEGVWTGRVLKE
ncbi:MAG: T9SS type A sorting domain-containing protein [Flavobacteriales bacterium]|nr:T9SS type A sorting domain-containing protein [Flavobacteriales bacterium]